MAISDYRFNPRSRESIRKQWGPSLEEETLDAQNKLIESGRRPSSFGSMAKWEAAVRKEINSAREARELISSPKARGKKISDQMATGEEARKQGDAAFEKASDLAEAKNAWKEWETNPDGSKSRWIPSSDKEDTRNLIQIETPSGGQILAQGKNIGSNFDKSVRADADKAAQLADMRAKGRVIADRLENDRANEMASQLAKKGITSEPRNEDGSFDFNKARGLLAQRTVETWDEEDRMLAKGKEKQRTDRQRLRLVNQALRDGRGDAATLQDEQSALRDATRYMNDQDLVEYGKRNEQKDLANLERTKEFESAQRKQADALLRRAEAANYSLSDEELKSMGLPSLNDEEGWKKAVDINPLLKGFYDALKPKVSRSGKVMTNALSAFV